MTSKSIALVMLASIASSQSYGMEGSLMDMELEKLMDMNVTTVTKRTQSYKDSAAAIFVITQNDIRRSGATVLPEVLDLAPGINAARINNFLWGVTARGELSQYAEKLLVMVDGRSVYHPYLSGVFWESVLPSLNEIERIEVIRGPGTSIWGANAVNGIINIITFDSEVTQVQRITAGAGNEERGFFRYRNGFRKGALTGRVNVDMRFTDDTYSPLEHTGAGDEHSTRQISSRFDWRPTINDVLSFDTGLSSTDLNGVFFVDAALLATQPVTEQPPRQEYGSKNSWIMSTWLHELNNRDSLQLKTYVDWEDREEQVYTYKRTTSDIDFQYNFAEAGANRFTWGLGARHIEDEAHGSFILSFSEDKLFYDKYTSFFQDEFKISNDLVATLGVKHEKNEFTKSQTQPSLRFGYSVSDETLAWASVSRAARTPATMAHVWNWKFGASPELESFVEQINAGSSDRTFVEAIGSFDYESEISNTYELGYRSLVSNRLIFDFVAYYSDLSKLRNLTFQGLKYYSSDDPDRVYTSYLTSLANEADGKSKGAELFIKVDIAPQLQSQLGYTYTKLTSKDELLFGTDYYPTLSFITPRNTVYILSRYSIGDYWDIDIKMKHVSKRYNDTVFGYTLPAYNDLDLRVAHRLAKDFYVAIVGKQLLDPSRSEITGTFLGPVPTEVERSVFVEISWR